MHISKFKPRNFKSFYEPDPIELAPGFNLVTGQNSAGKTALLEAMTLSFQNKPHRSLATIPIPGASINNSSSASLSIDLTRQELLDLVAGQTAYLPFPSFPDLIRAVNRNDQSLDAATQFLRKLFAENPGFTVLLKIDGNGNLIPDTFPSIGKYESFPQPGGGYLLIEFTLSNNGEISVRSFPQGNTDLGVTVGAAFRSRIYRFSAERFNLGLARFGNSTLLRTDAGNLPEVLNSLQQNPARFRKFNDILHSILPQVKQISVRPAPFAMDSVEILVWTVDPESQRADLAVPLNECGTGIGQVLAILYVVVNSDAPQTILIDEPQSFLHPGAARKLIEVLKRYSQHQFVIASHSPTVIAAASHATVTVLKIEQSETVPLQLDISQRNTAELYLDEVGARLGDLFGADDVLWVEGRTEELCAPKILQTLAKELPVGTLILGIRSTGDLESRDAKKILEIYNRITRGASLIPPALGFVLDLETRGQQERDDLVKQSGGLLSFTTRRTYENYLLNPGAIAAVASGIEGFREGGISTDDVAAFFEARRKEKAYFAPLNVEESETWIVSINGPKLLVELFNQLSDARVAYDKVEHSVMLTDWILRNSPKDLEELSQVYLTALYRGRRRLRREQMAPSTSSGAMAKP